MTETMPLTRAIETDVLVIGAGPAGLAAAVSAAERGARVDVIDENPRVGGQIWRAARDLPAPAPVRDWLRRARACPNLRWHVGHRAIAASGEHVLDFESAEGALRVRYRHVVLATGARELVLPFPGWTLPGVTGAGGLQALAKAGLPVADRRMVIAGTGPLLLASANTLRALGARVPMIAEAARGATLRRFVAQLIRHPRKLAQAARLRVSLFATRYRADARVLRAEGHDRVEAVVLSIRGREVRVACDWLGVGYGLVPNVELAAMLGCALDASTAQARVAVDQWQRTSQRAVWCAGEGTGIGGVDKALVEGEIAGLCAAGHGEQAARLFERRARAYAFAALIDESFAPPRDHANVLRDDTIVCRCEDACWGDLKSHGCARAAKLFTRAGMGACQGRVCGAAMAHLLGWSRETPRPPLVPARVATFAAEYPTIPPGEST